MEITHILLFVATFTIGIMAKPTLMEGDIAVDTKFLKIRQRGEIPAHSNSRSKRSISITDKLPHEHRWRNGFVPYKLSTDLGDDAREAIREGMKHVEKYTCIQFSPRRDEEDYVEFIMDKGCYSSIGRQNGRQVISIGEGCENSKTVVHEILHTLGMFHEQTRMDRGLYVKVLWWNVQRGAERNFAIYDHGVIDSMNFPYDYQSATHYHNTEFTKNGDDTMQSLEHPYQKLGNYRGLSKMDVKKIYQFYKCYKKKQRPQKAQCKDKYSWCSRYTNHCSAKWFADSYCQKSCKVCL